MRVVNSTLLVGEYRIDVLANDRGIPSKSGSATIFIAIIPSTPQEVGFTSSPYHFSVMENVELETHVGQVVALDHDNLTITQEDVYYSFSNANLTDCLHIDPESGTISTTCVQGLDRELQAQFELVVTATVVSTNETGMVGVVVSLTDLNDNSPTFLEDHLLPGDQGELREHQCRAEGPSPGQRRWL